MQYEGSSWGVLGKVSSFIEKKETQRKSQPLPLDIVILRTRTPIL
jgi:hypothetical protein